GNTLGASSLRLKRRFIGVRPAITVLDGQGGTSASAFTLDRTLALGCCQGRCCLTPISGVISDGQHAIRKSEAQALPGVPHPLCQFHYLREVAGPLYEADRHAKKELKNVSAASAPSSVRWKVARMRRPKRPAVTAMQSAVP